MRIFISATKDDLGPDCRPEVVNAIKVAAGDPHNMDDWNAEFHQPPTDLCQRELQENSTHYIGLFAFRRGWVPLGCDISITEMEYRWALDAKPPKEMAVYMPEPGSPIAKLLETRAAHEDPVARDKQAEFCKSVRGLKYVSAFKTVGDLAARVLQRVMLWKEGGSRPVALRFAGTAYRPPPPVHLLGREAHKRGFDDAWTLLAGEDLPGIAAFFLEGPQAAGRNELLTRLFLDAATDLFPIHLSVGARWSRKDLGALLAEIGGALQPGWVPVNPAELAVRLEQNLAHREILLAISGVESYPRGAAGFIEDFWRPLRQAFQAEPARRLSVFILSDKAPEEAARGHFHQPPAAFDPQEVFALPPLGNFSLVEIKTWLKTLQGVADPKGTAEDLFRATDGEPWRLLPKLQSEF